MATRNILKDGDKALNKKSREVTDFNKRLHILLDDMRETLIEANGLGLAAPQVGVLRRVALIVLISQEENGSHDEQIIELVNPEIIEQDGEQTGNEGCLSLPGVYGVVTRPDHIKIKAFDRYGNAFELEGNQLTARAVCHEIDHLEGVIFTSIAERLLTEEELAEMAEQREQESRDGDENQSE